MSFKFGFVGGGKMAAALVHGLIAAKLCDPSEIAVSDPNSGSLGLLRAAFPKLNISTDNNIPASAEVLVIAVKPHLVALVLKGLHSAINVQRTLVISVAAGVIFAFAVPIATIEANLPFETRVIRVMPNVAATVGAGAAGFALGCKATTRDENTCAALFRAVGIAWRVEERLLDAVCGLSGSGPAYVFLVIEALADGGVRMGLPRELAISLAAQTVYGAGKLALAGSAQGTHLSALRDSVTSPGGTTAQGLAALEDAAVRAAFQRAVRDATEQSVRLGLPKSRL